VTFKVRGTHSEFSLNRTQELYVHVP